MTTVLHVSDVHFGKPAVPEQVDAIEQLIQTRRFDVVAVSGDMSQRARPGEFQRARAFLRDAARVSATIVVPGNHDVKWWRAPLGIGMRTAVFSNYRRYVSADLEPVLRVPGVTFVGLNTAHGVQTHTLTWNPRDIGVVGNLEPGQVEHARRAFEASPAGDRRAIVMHHNPLKGQLSRRYGLAHRKTALGAFESLGVDLVMCGHDHQEAIHFVEHPGGGTVVSTAGTVSDRSRGGRPSSINLIAIDPGRIVVHTLIWNERDSAFGDGPTYTFER
ncbi:MAG TPA: metallophosphoesterase [Gemmatimonadaceae bacterium]|nr:metallophosphoesterase [Gemmatimonadaceae bacterium]